MRHEEDLRRHQLRPTREEIARSREAYRELLAEAGLPADAAEPREQTSIVVRGPYGWTSGPC